MQRMFRHTLILLVLIIGQGSFSQIDRKALVTRHNVKVSAMDTLSSLTVGNGSFAFTVDATGLQTFPERYQNGVPLGTESEWGWNSFPNNEEYTFDETLQEFDQFGRKVKYSVQGQKSERAKGAINYFRANPHRVQLGNIGFELFKKNGEPATPEDIQQIDQKLNLWTGIIESHFTVEGKSVHVWTASDQESDAIGVKIESELIKTGQLKIRIRFPFPTAGWTDIGTLWQSDRNYTSTLSMQKNGGIINHKMDSLSYQIGLKWNGKAELKKKENQYFILEPSGKSEFAFTASFSNEKTEKLLDFSTLKRNSEKGWEDFWESGAAVDFSESTDPRAHELERRVVLSQYLTKVQCTGEMPPQETGLTYNSWYGRPHLEMHWWHSLHFALWDRAEYLEKTLPWYKKTANKAQKLAERQGFEGVRWQKMTGPYGNDTPSSVGAFLIWQQPHYITFAELLYTQKPTAETLETYKNLVFETADFMASFAHYNSEEDRYELGPGIIPAQERFKPFQTINPTYELAYWDWALRRAIKWKKRLGETPNTEWQNVVDKLSPLPIQENIYLAVESAPDSYTNPEYKTDHPAVLGTLGMLPESEILDKEIMKNTFNLIWDTWSWDETWGWDFPMTAMTATRLGMPEKAIESLFMDVETNTFLPNGHNYQNETLTLYLPGNGGLLTAVALMCAGWEGNEIENPGFPKNGKWNVKWEGLKPMF